MQQPAEASQPSLYENTLTALRAQHPIASRLFEPALAGMTGAVATSVAGLAGAAAVPFQGADAANTVRDVQSALTYQPRTREGQALLNAGTAPLRAFSDFALESGDAPVPVNARASLASGGVIPMQMRTPGPVEATARNVLIQALPNILLARGRPGTVPAGRAVAPRQGGATPAAAVPQRAPAVARVPAAPSVEELGAQASAAYKRASDAGIKIAPASFANLKNKIGVLLNKEGLNKSLHPDTAAAFKEIAGTKGELTLDQLETLRKIANDAKGSIKPADSRLASIVVDEIDDYVGALERKDITSGNPKAASALAEARGLYARKKKAEEIGQLIEKARISAPNFSASGMENALRTEFRSLAKNQRRMRRFTAEEQAAIKKVAMGGKMENALRMIGKMAPTGAVSGMFGILSTAAVPGGAALPIAGLAGRYAATRMTKANAMRAEELMRRGPPPKPPRKPISDTEKPVSPKRPRKDPKGKYPDEPVSLGFGEFGW